MARGDDIIRLSEEAASQADRAAARVQGVSDALSPLSRGSTPSQVKEASRTALVALVMSLQDAAAAAHTLGQLESAGEMTDG